MTSEQTISEHPILGKQTGSYQRAQNRGALVGGGILLFLGLLGLAGLVRSVMGYGRIFRAGLRWDDYLMWGILLALQLLLISLAVYLFVRHFRARDLHIWVYAAGLVWLQRGEETVIRWDDIQTLRHNESNSSFRGMRIVVKNYQIELENGRTYSFDRLIDNVSTLGSQIQNKLRPRLKAELLAQLQQNNIVPFGDLSLGRDGLYHREQLIPWQAIESATIAKDHFYVRGEGREVLAKVRAWRVPNLFLLQEYCQSQRNGRIPRTAKPSRPKQEPLPTMKPKPQKINDTDWVWPQTGLTLRYLYMTASSFPQNDPMIAYTTAPKKYEHAYQKYWELRRTLDKMRADGEPDVRMEAVAEPMQEFAYTYKAAKAQMDCHRPLVKIAICPYCQTEVWRVVGLFSLADRAWYHQESNGRTVPASSICEHLFCVTGALGLNGHEPTEQYAPPDANSNMIRMAAGVPFVLPRLLNLGCTAVLHAIPVAQKYTAYPITYFTPTPLAEDAHFCIPWGCERFGGMAPYRDGRSIAFTGWRSDKQEYDLNVALDKEQLQWLAVQKQKKLVTVKTGKYPYEDLNGRRHPYTIQDGVVHDLPDPQAAPPHIELGDLDESFDR